MDVKAAVAEQIALGQKAGELLANPAFKQAVEDLAVKHYKEFRAANVQNPSELLMAHLKQVALDLIVDEMTQMYGVGMSNSRAIKG